MVQFMEFGIGFLFILYFSWKCEGKLIVHIYLVPAET